MSTCVESAARAAVLEIGPLAPPGWGDTRARFAALRAVARRDLCVARLVEPHLDATAIVTEADAAPPPPGELWAVWASRSSTPPTLQRRDGGFTLWGEQPFASGALVCDAALVAVNDAATGDELLVRVELRAGRAEGSVRADTSGWRTPAFAATTTAAVTFDDVPIAPDAVIGPPDHYLQRPGFWHGALGPAAVWAGGAEGLVDAAEALPARSVHERVGLGELRALAWSMRAQLDRAADDADAAPGDAEAARVRALVVRHLVERECTRVIEVFTRTYGPRPLAFDAEVIARVQELQLYLRQVHHGADLEELGADAVGDLARGGAAGGAYATGASS
jgi:alkylation response protein AidB-like acyl-CoA dehydrogenase